MFCISDVKIKRVKRKGRGVFATKDIPAGTVVGDYLGTVIRAEEEDEHARGLYAMYYSEKTSIEPEKNERGIHLINHSCTPNCFMYTHKRHCLYVSLRKIFKGEEITVHYCVSGPDEECDPCTHKCYCGSPMCFGTMHLSDSEYDKWDAYFTKQEKGTPAKPPVAYGERLPALQSYPRRVADPMVFPMYGNWRKEPFIVSKRAVPALKEIRKLIRSSGRALYFPSPHLVVEGVMQGRIIARRSDRRGSNRGYAD